MIKTNYKSLNFFKRGHELTLNIYKITKTFPKEEIFGLTSQLRRASSAIGSNIAEGSGRNTLKDYKQFLHIALGSAKEIEYQLLLVKDLNYITYESYEQLTILLNEIIGSLKNYIKKLETNLTL